MAGVPGAVREEGLGWGGGRQTLRQRTPVPVSLAGLLVLSGLSGDHEGSFFLGGQVAWFSFVYVWSCTNRCPSLKIFALFGCLLFFKG